MKCKKCDSKVTFWKFVDTGGICETCVNLAESIKAESEFVTWTDEDFISIETEKIKKRERRRKYKELAEERYFGESSKVKRTAIPPELRKEVLQKYSNRCAVCEVKEGLEIHHKDLNPSNNKIENLVVLCGLHHKKIHMKL